MHTQCAPMIIHCLNILQITGSPNGNINTRVHKEWKNTLTKPYFPITSRQPFPFQEPNVNHLLFATMSCKWGPIGYSWWWEIDNSDFHEAVALLNTTEKSRMNFDRYSWFILNLFRYSHTFYDTVESVLTFNDHSMNSKSKRSYWCNVDVNIIYLLL